MLSLEQPAVAISAVQRQLFRDEGYMILEGAIPIDILQWLREECSYFMGYSDAGMDLRNTVVDGINHRGNRYFKSNRYRLRPRMAEFIFSSLMAEVAMACLGPDVYLFSQFSQERFQHDKEDAADLSPTIQFRKDTQSQRRLSLHGRSLRTKWEYHLRRSFGQG